MRRRRIYRLLVFWLACITVCIVVVNVFSVSKLHQTKDPTRKELGVAVKETREEEKNVFHVAPETSDKMAVFDDTKLGMYEPAAEETVRHGPGEGGKPVVRNSGEHRDIHTFGCDMAVSDMIALDRSIPDTRHSECKHWHYPKDLPSTSVVIVFYNEGNSTLLRTVHSVLNRSPPALLLEVVLVDDASTMDHLKKPLEDYIKRFKGKVKLYRNEERLGLIGARMRGAKEAIGDVIVVLDSHCECNVNWLPPLLQRIALNRKTLAQPVVDFITYGEFQYYSLFGNYLPKGVFDWGLLYKEMAVSPAEISKRKHASEPYGTPTHAGGLFAIDRKYFLEIGGYDENILVWGGENFQLSFKIWMCGGRLEMVPCSRVGHVYHSGMPYSMKVKATRKLKITPDNHNYVRVAEGWMDEYKEYFYIRFPELRSYHVNVSDQLQLRKRLGCKSFKWFMENVAVGLLNHHPLPLPNVAWGKLKERHGNRCVTASGNLGHCFSIFRVNNAGNIASGEYCLSVHTRSSNLHMPKCPDSSKHQWDWNRDLGLIRHPTLDTCIMSTTSGDLVLDECDPDEERQQFEMVEKPVR